MEIALNQEVSDLRLKSNRTLRVQRFINRILQPQIRERIGKFLLNT